MSDDDFEELWGVSKEDVFESDEYQNIRRVRSLEIRTNHKYERYPDQSGNHEIVVDALDNISDKPVEVADVLEADAEELQKRAERMEEQAEEIREHNSEAGD